MVRRGALFLVASLLLGACGESAAEPTLAVAGLAELSGPYRPEPFEAFDPALVTLLRDTCLHDFAGEVRLADGLKPVLVDGRGGGRFIVLLAAPGGEADCIGKIDAGGTPSSEGGSSGGGGASSIGPREVFPGGSGSGSGMGGDAYGYVTGYVGSEIGGVVLELDGGSRVTASLGGGRYAAWWPNDHQAARILAYDRNGALVGETPP